MVRYGINNMQQETRHIYCETLARADLGPVSVRCPLSSTYHLRVATDGADVHGVRGIKQRLALSWIELALVAPECVYLPVQVKLFIEPK